MSKLNVIIAGNMKNEECVKQTIRQTNIYQSLLSYDPAYVEIFSCYKGGVANQIATELEVSCRNFRPNSRKYPNKDLAVRKMQEFMCNEATNEYGGRAIIVWNGHDTKVKQLLDMCFEFNISQVEVINVVG